MESAIFQARDCCWLWADSSQTGDFTHFPFWSSVCHACPPHGPSFVSFTSFPFMGIVSITEVPAVLPLCPLYQATAVTSHMSSLSGFMKPQCHAQDITAQLRIRQSGRTQSPSEDVVIIRELSTRLCFVASCFSWLTTTLLLCVSLILTSSIENGDKCETWFLPWATLGHESWRPRAISMGWIGKKNDHN